MVHRTFWECHVTKCIFRLVDCLLCSETFLHFCLDLVCFYKATFQSVPKFLCKSHMSTTILLLVRVHLFIFLYSVILVMHLFQKEQLRTDWSVCLLGRIVFSPQLNRSRVYLQLGRDQLVQMISDLLFWCRSKQDCCVHTCLNKLN